MIAQPYTNERGSNAIRKASEDRSFVLDTLTLANLTLTNTPVEVYDIPYYWLNPDWPSDGILAINRALDDDFHTPLMTADDSALERLRTAFNGQFFAAIVLNSAPPSDASGLGGMITFGARDEEHCATKWIKLDGGDDSWSITVVSFSLGDTAHSEPMFATVVTTSTFIRVPQSFFDNVISELGALYDYDSDAYYLECSHVSTLPDLSFRISPTNVVGTLDYRVPASDYARQVYLGLKDRCYLMLTAQEMFGYARHYASLSLGTTFMRSHCLLLDYSSGKVAVARKKE